MVRIRRFGVVKTATVVAVMYMLVVAVIAIPAALLAVAFGRDSGGTGALAIIAIGGFAAVVYGIGGWIVTAIACAVYNLVARLVGGIEVQLESVAPISPPPVWGPISSGTPPPPSPPSPTAPYSS